MCNVSIVMATYNGEKYIREQIDSILANSYPHWSLEICDDGSKDKTIEITKEYEEKYPDKITVHVNESNIGVVRNFLDGAIRAKGDYIMFCDQDDVWLPNKISKTLDYLKQMEQKYGSDMPLCVFADAKVVNKDLVVTNESFHQSNKLDCNKIDLSHILMENKLIGCTIMFNQALRNKLTRMPDKARVHDWWIGLIASSFGKIGYLSEGTLLYRQHESNVIGNQNFTDYIRNRMGSLKKQRQALLLTQQQAGEFYKIYKSQLPEKERDVIQTFASLHKKNWIVRRIIMIRFQFFKTGIIRNIGVFMLI